VAGHYICVKPTQGIFKKRLCNPKNNCIFLLKGGGQEYKKPRLQKIYTKTRVQIMEIHGDTNNVHAHVTTGICHLSTIICTNHH